MPTTSSKANRVELRKYSKSLGNPVWCGPCCDSFRGDFCCFIQQDARKSAEDGDPAQSF